MKIWIFALLATALLLPERASAAPVTEAGEAARLAIQSAGRAKPLDTFAAESLQSIHGRRTVAHPVSGQRIGATEAILGIWLGENGWRSAPVILVSDPEIREELGLPRARHFSFDELMANPAVARYFSVVEEKRSRKQALTPLEREAEVILGRINLFNAIRTGQAMRILPHPESAGERWGMPHEAKQYYPLATAAEVGAALSRFSGAYRSGDQTEFDAASVALAELLRSLAPDHYPTTAAIAREVHYNQTHPFRLAWIFYLLGFFFLLPRKTYKIGMTLFSIGFMLNVYGFVLRSWIAERAPVTNMYETVVWTALSLAIFALIFEAIYRSRLYALCAAPMAVLALILADMLPTVLDPTINPLPPVLRDNFWLVTHVVTIMIGYAAFALAAAMGHYILARYLLKPGSVNERSEVHYMLDRVLYLGIIFLAAGTLLGGIWAYYSWGRFWGWDPKETWSLIALLLYIFANHGKFAGWWGHFGIAVGACLCFHGILMTWYGVNFVLGAGLHSYGFGGGGTHWIALVVGLDILFVATCVAIKIRRDRREHHCAPAGAAYHLPS